jgi:hypothetical protein
VLASLSAAGPNLILGSSASTKFATPGRRLAVAFANPEVIS